MSVLDDLPRGVPGRKPGEQQMPHSQWLDPERLVQSEAFRFDPSKIFLGVVGGTVQDSGQEYFVRGGTPLGIGDDRHVVLCAGSRAGKGRSCLVPTLLEYAGSALVLDPKGELATITARRRAELGQRVCVVDPFGVSAPRLASVPGVLRPAGFNPLALLDPASPRLIVDAGLIADALIVGRSESDPHWDESARDLLEGLILHVATYMPYKDERTLLKVRDLLKHSSQPATDPPEDFEGTLPPQLQVEILENAELHADNPDLAGALDGAAGQFYDKPDRERASVLSVALRNTKFLDYPELRESLSRHDFDLADLKTAESGLTIYLCLPAGLMATCNRWFRLFVNLAFEAMEREHTRPAIPVLAVLEEFHVLGYMQQIEVAAALMAGFGMKLLIVLQDLTQLKRHYKDGWETFLGNCGVAVFFGNSDMTTLEFISKRCGQTSLIVYRGSEVTHAQRKGGATGDSWSVEVREVLTPEEASRFLGRDDVQQRQLIIRPGLSPALIQRVKYDMHEFFKDKRGRSKFDDAGWR